MEGGGLAMGESGSCSDGQGHAHEIFNPIFCWWVGLCFLPAASLRSNSDRGYSSLLQKYLYQDCCSQYPWPHGRSLQAHASTGDSWTFIGKPGSVSCGGYCSFRQVLVNQTLCSPRLLFPQSHGSSAIKPHQPLKSNSLGVLSPFAGSPDWEICCGPRTFTTTREFLWHNCPPACWLFARCLCGWACTPLLPYLLQPEPLYPGQATADPCLRRSHSTLKGRSGWASCGAPASSCVQSFVWALQATLMDMGFDSKHDFAPPTILLGFSFALGHGVSFFGGIQHSPVNGCSVVSCNFSVLPGEDECTSF